MSRLVAERGWPRTVSRAIEAAKDIVRRIRSCPSPGVPITFEQARAELDSLLAETPDEESA